jgi:excisionase family DNA binding protein
VGNVLESLLDVSEVAERLGCSGPTVRQRARLGTLAGFKKYRQWLFREVDIEQVRLRDEAERTTAARAADRHTAPHVPVHQSSATEQYSPYITVNQAARYLNVHPKTVYRAMWSGRVQARRFGRSWRLKREWLDSFLEDATQFMR